MDDITTLQLGQHYDEFIQSLISSGRYESLREVIRYALQLLEEEEYKVELLKKELIIGEESGVIEHFDFDEHIRLLKEKWMNAEN